MTDTVDTKRDTDDNERDNYCYYNESELQFHTKLILCIEELSLFDPSIIERRIFIGWNKDTSKFFVRGKVEDSSKVKYVPFAFSNEYSDEIYGFIKFVIGDNKINTILYNYNNLYDKDVDTLPYEFFENLLDSSHELSGYNEDKMNRSKFINLLSMLTL